MNEFEAFLIRIGFTRKRDYWYKAPCTFLWVGDDRIELEDRKGNHTVRRSWKDSLAAVSALAELGWT